MTKLEICNLALSKLGEPKVETLGDTSVESSIHINDIYKPTLDELLALYRWAFARKSSTLFVDWVSMTSVASGSGAVLVTKVDHGLTTGDRIAVENTATADGWHRVAVVDDDSFTLEETLFLSTTLAGRFSLAPAFGWSYILSLPADCVRVRSVNGYEAGHPRATPYVREGATLLSDEVELDLIYTKSMDGREADMPSTFVQLFAWRLAAASAMLITGAIARQEAAQGGYEQALFPALQANASESGDRNPDFANTSPEGYWTRS